MADEVQQINPDAFASLARKLDGLMGQLTPDERTLLGAIMGLAEQTLTTAREDEVSGHALLLTSPQFLPLVRLQTDFHSAFGPLVQGFGPGVQNRLDFPER